MTTNVTCSKCKKIIMWQYNPFIRQCYTCFQNWGTIEEKRNALTNETIVGKNERNKNTEESNEKNAFICPSCNSTLTETNELPPRAADECSMNINKCYNCTCKWLSA
jgi:hypothetical protein